MADEAASGDAGEAAVHDLDCVGAGVQGLAAACGRGCNDGTGGNDPDCMGAGVQGRGWRQRRSGCGVGAWEAWVMGRLGHGSFGFAGGFALCEVIRGKWSD